MNKTTNKSTTHNAGLPLEDHALDSVSGGAIKGALEGVCTKGGDEGGGQKDPTAQMFQQLLQQISQR